MKRIVLAVVLGSAGMGVQAQVAATATPGAPAAPRATGTVKAVTSDGFTLTAAAGDVTVRVATTAKVMVVPPGSKDLKAATPGTLADITVGDRALVTGTVGDASSLLSASRVILMKAGAIASAHEADAAAWAQGGGGIVKSVDASGGVIVLSSGGKTVTVNTTAKTIVRRYAPGSVKFDDATLAKLSDVRAGDQLRVRGAKSADGATVTADEVVAGSFANYSGLLTGIDATAGTITLKDLASKKTVTVAVTSGSDVHRLPAAMGAMVAARMKGGAAPAGAGAGAGRPGGEGGAGRGGAARAGSDLSGMMQRLPTETLGGLKPGEAVMMVATQPADAAGKPTAVTLLVGVDAILASSGGETMTLSPWSLSGGGGGAEE